MPRIRLILSILKMSASRAIINNIVNLRTFEMKKMLAICCLLIHTFMHAQTDVDTIYMKNGSKYPVSIIKQTRDTIQYMPSSEEGKVIMKQVDRVYFCNFNTDEVDDFTGDRFYDR